MILIPINKPDKENISNAWNTFYNAQDDNNFSIINDINNINNSTTQEYNKIIDNIDILKSNNNDNSMSIQADNTRDIIKEQQEILLKQSDEVTNFYIIHHFERASTFHFCVKQFIVASDNLSLHQTQYYCIKRRITAS